MLFYISKKTIRDKISTLYKVTKERNIRTAHSIPLIFHSLLYHVFMKGNTKLATLVHNCLNKSPTVLSDQVCLEESYYNQENTSNCQIILSTSKQFKQFKCILLLTV